MICGRHGHLLCRVPACVAQEQHQAEVAIEQANARDEIRRQEAAGDTINKEINR